MELPDLVKDGFSSPRPQSHAPPTSSDFKLDLLANHLKVNAVDNVTTDTNVMVEEQLTISASSSSSTTAATVSPVRAPAPAPAPVPAPVPAPAAVFPTSFPLGPGASERSRKIELLRMFHELERRGIQISGRYDLESRLVDMEQEYEIVRSVLNKKQAITLYKGFMLNAVQAMEFLNDTYNPFDFHLHGWSEHLSLKMDDYDEVLGELYEKYKHTGRRMEPELKLVLMILMSATTFHASHTLLNSIPQVGPTKVQTVSPPVPPQQSSGAGGGGGGGGPGNGAGLHGPDARAFLDRLKKQQSRPAPPPPQPRPSAIIIEDDGSSMTPTSLISSITSTSRRKKKPVTINV